MKKLHRRSDDAHLPPRAVQAWEHSLAKLEQSSRESPAVLTANRADAQFHTQRLVEQAARVAPPKPDALLKGLLLPRREAGPLPSMPMRAMAIDAALSPEEHRRVALYLAQAYLDGQSGAANDSPWLDAGYVDKFLAGNFRSIEPPPASLDAWRQLLRSYRPPGPSTGNVLACAEAYDTVVAQRRRAPDEAELQLDEDERALAQECLRLAHNNWQGLHAQARPPRCLSGLRLLLRGVEELANNPGEMGTLLALFSLREEDWAYLREQPTAEAQRHRRAKALHRREAGLLQLAEMVAEVQERSRVGHFESAQQTVAAAYDEVDRGRYSERGVTLLRGLLGHYLARANEQGLQASWRSDAERGRRLLAQAIALCEPRQLALPPLALTLRLTPTPEAVQVRSPGMRPLRPQRPPPLTPALLGSPLPTPTPTPTTTTRQPLRSPPPSAPPREPLPTPPVARRTRPERTVDAPPVVVPAVAQPWVPASSEVESITGAYLEDYFREVEQAVQDPRVGPGTAQASPSPSPVASSEADLDPVASGARLAQMRLRAPDAEGEANAPRLGAEVGTVPQAGRAPGPASLSAVDIARARLSRTSSRTLHQRPNPSPPPPLPNTEPLQLLRDRRASQGATARTPRLSQGAMPHRLLFEAMPEPTEPSRVDEALVRALLPDAGVTSDRTRSAQAAALVLALDGRPRGKAACIELLQRLESGNLHAAAAALPEVQQAVAGLDTLAALRQRLADAPRYAGVLAELSQHGEGALPPVALRCRLAAGLRANGNVERLENALRDGFARLEADAVRPLLALLTASTPPGAGAWTVEASPLLEAMRVWEPDWAMRAAATQLVHHIDAQRDPGRSRGALILLGRYLVLQGPAGSLLCDSDDPQDPAGKLTWRLGESNTFPKASDQLVAALTEDYDLHGESLVVYLHQANELQQVRFRLQWADADEVLDWLDEVETLLSAAADNAPVEPLLERLENAARGDCLEAELKLFGVSPNSSRNPSLKREGP